MPWHELLAYMIVTGDVIERYQSEPASAYRTPSVSVFTRNGAQYVSSWEGLELRGDEWWRKVRWNRV